jgi:VanW like protein
MSMRDLGSIDLAIHRIKANVHRTLRWIDDRREPIPPARTGRLLVDLELVAEDRSKLWNAIEDPREWPLEQGKVENLRVAARMLDGLELEAGQVFSFWTQVGPPLRVRNFVLGRELREGCVVPGIGGGLCLLSNALYSVARTAGHEVLERHAHSRRPPGSRAAEGSDATVAWNYVDLRFRAKQAWRLEVRLDAEWLIVGVRTERRRDSMRVLHDRRQDRREDRREDRRQERWIGDAGRSCLSCERDCDAATRPKLSRSSSQGRRSWLLDGAWPELVRYLEAQADTDDRVLQPIDGELIRTPRYAWPRVGSSRPTQFPAQTLIRSLRARALAQQGPARQRALLEDQRRLAAAMAASLEPRDTQLIVAQDLLAHLELLGVLGGRRVTVLMQRLSLFELQARLDEAHARHPQSRTLADFRADPRLLEAEARALDDAVEIVTPHPEIAACFPGKATRLDWALPRVARGVASKQEQEREPGPLRLWLPTSTVGRKGVYELREALAGRRCELWIAGHELEGAGFWAGVETCKHGSPALGSIDAVVLPAWIENQPRALLRAIAAGVPVIASRACGVEGLPSVRTVAAGDVGDLRAALVALASARLDHEIDEAASVG